MRPIRLVGTVPHPWTPFLFLDLSQKYLQTCSRRPRNSRSYERTFLIFKMSFFWYQSCWFLTRSLHSLCKQTATYRSSSKALILVTNTFSTYYTMLRLFLCLVAPLWVKRRSSAMQTSVLLTEDFNSENLNQESSSSFRNSIVFIEGLSTLQKTGNLNYIMPCYAHTPSL